MPLWVARFASGEDPRSALLAFRDRHNRQWLIERDGYLSPSVLIAACAAALAA